MKKVLSFFNFTLPQLVFIAGSFGLLLLARVVSFNFESHDYTYFLKGWFAHLREFGFNFTENFSNYNFPYLYLMWFGSLFTDNGLYVVKIIAVLCDILLAVALYKFVRLYRSPKFSIVLALIGFTLPEVLINSAVWGQADVIYTTALVWSLYFFKQERNKLGWLLFIVSFSFKLQAVFILPALIVWFIIKKHTITDLVPGLAYFVVSFIPALLGGRPFDQLFYAYSNQVDSSAVIMSNFIAHVSAIFLEKTPFPEFKYVLLFLTAVVVALFCFAALQVKDKLLADEHALLKLSTLFALVMPFILPNMMNRYFYVALVLMLLLVSVKPVYILGVLALQINSWVIYGPSLWTNAPTLVPLQVLSFIHLAVIVGFLYVTYKNVVKEVDWWKVAGGQRTI